MACRARTCANEAAGPLGRWNAEYADKMSHPVSTTSRPPPSPSPLSVRLSSQAVRKTEKEDRVQTAWLLHRSEGGGPGGWMQAASFGIGRQRGLQRIVTWTDRCSRTARQ
ncbi:hypothetical protein IF2G_09519 [Cordyceps javanica]|nr:hypothetical protein IF2G_09519 [Cordyceps javanica]